jgi:hypothetical protein
MLIQKVFPGDTELKKQLNGYRENYRRQKKISLKRRKSLKKWRR